MSHRIIIGLTICFSLLGVGWAQEQSNPEPFYVIRSGDLLDIFVWKEPELSRKVLVRPDGRISFPLVQDLEASGLTPIELKTKMETQLAEYLAAPNVTVIVDQINNYTIYVTGKVNGPSGLTLPRPINVLQAIAMVGGFAEFADEGDIKIIRAYGDDYVYLEFNYKDVIKGKKTEQNIILRSGDVVVVP
jgi:polysaccharide export outer membrane protein